MSARRRTEEIFWLFSNPKVAHIETRPPAADFKVTDANAFDVVLLDWGRQTGKREDFPPTASPFSERERDGRSRPCLPGAVAGLNLAVVWQMKGGNRLQPAWTRWPTACASTKSSSVPFKIDRSKIDFPFPTPEDFQAEIKGAGSQGAASGQRSQNDSGRPVGCTYSYDFASNPDEWNIFSGGVNHKTADPRRGLWRQGQFSALRLSKQIAGGNE